MQDFLQHLKNTVDIVEVIGNRIQLKKKGREYSACCPFHNEKTPSFSVNPQKGFYHCFGCGAHGDAIKFVQDFDNLSFMDAVKSLAGHYGLNVPAPSKDAQIKSDKQTRLIRALELAQVYFIQQFFKSNNNQAQTYLHQRGITQQMQETFGIGYAPDSWDGMKNTLAQAGISEADMLDAGLLSQSDNGRIYDKFRGRLMFPIHDKQGRIIAFGGRTLIDDSAKYLNSPETDVFHKSLTLYGRYQGITAKTKDNPIVVEGYMDVIALHQAGFTSAVAPLGTAITEQHITQLFHMSDEPVVCLDGDKAGQSAMLRMIERMMPILKPGKTMSFISLPDKLDPDDFIKKFGANAFQKTLQAPQSLTNALLSLTKPAGNSPEKNAQWLKQLTAIAATIEDADLKSLFSSDLRSKAWNIIRATKRGKNTTGLNTPTLNKPRTDIAAKALIAAVINNPDLAANVWEQLSNMSFNDERLDKVRQHLLSAVTDYSITGNYSPLSVISDDLKQFVTSTICVKSVYDCYPFAAASQDSDAALKAWQNVHDRLNIGASKPKAQDIDTEAGWHRYKQARAAAARLKQF